MTLDTTRPVYILLFAAIVSGAFTAGIVTLQVATAEKVQQNEMLRERRALVELFAPQWDLRMSGLADTEVLRLYEERIDDTTKVVDTETQPPTEFRVYRAYASAERGELVGLALPVWGPGFWQRIGGYVAVSPDLEEVLGVVFTEQKETPGLGGRITEEEFEERFRPGARKAENEPPLRATPPKGEAAKFIYIGRGEPSGPGDPRYGRSVDAITGATQTSLAVERFLNRRLRQFHRAWENGLKPLGEPAEGAAGDAWRASGYRRTLALNHDRLPARRDCVRRSKRQRPRRDSTLRSE